MHCIVRAYCNVKTNRIYCKVQICTPPIVFQLPGWCDPCCLFYLLLAFPKLCGHKVMSQPLRIGIYNVHTVDGRVMNIKSLATYSTYCTACHFLLQKNSRNAHKIGAFNIFRKHFAIFMQFPNRSILAKHM